jgi:hypothetical protein
MRYPLPPFANLLAEHMQRAKFTAHEMSLSTGWPLSYCRRILHPSTMLSPNEPTIHVMADTLGLDPMQRDELLAAAGYLPSDDGILALAYHIECARQSIGDEDTCPRLRRPTAPIVEPATLPY